MLHVWVSSAFLDCCSTVPYSLSSSFSSYSSRYLEGLYPLTPSIVAQNLTVDLFVCRSMSKRPEKYLGRPSCD
jgi:hypothetical protein